MNLNVSREAAEWYASEMDLKPGDYLQFVVKIYGGIPTVHPDYYLGISIGEEGSIGIKNVVEGITFYFSVEDSWFLKEYDLDIIKKDNDVEYIFK
ncbi:HesB/YadR/YfhF family protein [Metabacillus fastidiosus]|uniref:HesB/YadR/YfhF family protein n=1 Tax=Metabacillus fastidiosus TaxID=1458 RepID=UPI003D28F191